MEEFLQTSFWPGSGALDGRGSGTLTEVAATDSPPASTNCFNTVISEFCVRVEWKTLKSYRLCLSTSIYI